MIKKYIENILKSYQKIGFVNQQDEHNLPSRESVKEILIKIKEILFPGYFDEHPIGKHNLSFLIGEKVLDTADKLSKEVLKSICWRCKIEDKENCPSLQTCKKKAKRIINDFIKFVPKLRDELLKDIKAFFAEDPAAKSEHEIILAYPGFQAVLSYRIAHFLHSEGVPLIPRLMMEIVHSDTGIDIHPGATIGQSFCIDHGTGVVIGETSVIGNNVKLYQGVTIGALSVKKDLKGKRHPTIEDNVTIYARTTILGGKTTIGKNSVIGGNVWLIKSVPPNSTIYIAPDKNQIKKTK
ncbi:serine O-acetyltransferase EpsC [Candidatus Margulisiibacteriota bacterium]